MAVETKQYLQLHEQFIVALTSKILLALFHFCFMVLEETMVNQLVLKLYTSTDFIKSTLEQIFKIMVWMYWLFLSGTILLSVLSLERN